MKRLVISAVLAGVALAAFALAADTAGACPNKYVAPQNMDAGFTTATPHGADFYGANPGQRITYTTPLHEAMAAFLEGRSIQPTNLLRDGDCIGGQELTSGKMKAGAACDLALGLYNAQR